jgi:hypothetical protein
MGVGGRKAAAPSARRAATAADPIARREATAAAAPSARREEVLMVVPSARRGAAAVARTVRRAPVGAAVVLFAKKAVAAARVCPGRMAWVTTSRAEVAIRRNALMSGLRWRRQWWLSAAAGGLGPTPSLVASAAAP